ncbi:MAG: NAD(P)H-quinone oxidoreductase [Granulosicoccus sp.]
MQIIETREFGTPEVLIQGLRARPEPQKNEVLVKVFAAGVNGPDLVQRRGHYPPPKDASDLLGLEVSGEVVAVGTSVKRWKTGDTLCALTNGGGYAEYVCIDEEHCLPVPDGVAAVDTAGLPETYLTVWSNCFFQKTWTPGDVFLVHGGAGGIGSTAIQLGAALGLNVMTTCSSRDDASFCLALGASQTIDYKNEDFVEHVKAAGGANLILDIIGGDYVARNIKAASADATIIQLAFNAGSTVEINLMPIMLKRLTYTGSTLRSRPASFKAAVARDLEEKVWPLFTQGKLKPLTYCTLPFSEAIKSHQIMEAGEHRGKILLTPD